MIDVRLQIKAGNVIIITAVFILFTVWKCTICVEERKEANTQKIANQNHQKVLCPLDVTLFFKSDYCTSSQTVSGQYTLQMMYQDMFTLLLSEMYSQTHTYTCVEG